jgi:L-lactate utilization protein LutC
MSQEHHTNKNSPSETKSEREILELRIDQKLTDAKEALRSANQTELERIAREKHEPKFKRLLGTSGVVIAILIAGNLWQWFGITERIQKEAGRIFHW